jgi:hypothetical protein
MIPIPCVSEYVCYAANCDDTLPSANSCLHLVVYHHCSLHNTPVHRFIPYVP